VLEQLCREIGLKWGEGEGLLVRGSQLSGELGEGLLVRGSQLSGELGEGLLVRGSQLSGELGEGLLVRGSWLSGELGEGLLVRGSQLSGELGEGLLVRGSWLSGELGEELLVRSSWLSGELGEELLVRSSQLSGELGESAPRSTSSMQGLGSGDERSTTPRSPNNQQPLTNNQEPLTNNLPPVAFLGPAFGAAKDQLLRQADAFILPSFSEGLPMSVLEAWSYRLPVLMTEHCNLPEGFANDAAIRIGTDVESIAEGMRLLQQSTIRDLQSIGQNGRSLVERQFTWPQVAAQMKEVYEWLLGGGLRPGCVRE